MSLRNLLQIGQLVEHETGAAEIRRLLESAKRAIADARNERIGAETRFDAAYRAIMQSATAALWANGYRPSTSVPGHHRTTLQAMVHAIGMDATRVAVLDRLRHKRNLIDYTGEDIDDVSVTACIDEAMLLVKEVEVWIRAHRPDSGR